MKFIHIFVIFFIILNVSPHLVFTQSSEGSTSSSSSNNTNTTESVYYHLIPYDDPKCEGTPYGVSYIVKEGECTALPDSVLHYSVISSLNGSAITFKYVDNTRPKQCTGNQVYDQEYKVGECQPAGFNSNIGTSYAKYYYVNKTVEKPTIPKTEYKSSVVYTFHTLNCKNITSQVYTIGYPIELLYSDNTGAKYFCKLAVPKYTYCKNLIANECDPSIDLDKFHNNICKANSSLSYTAVVQCL
ncbi:hypothetical protein DLAC_09734 [Tieghemostelium lacteum]|uniref:Uncharacterized protein n=1 Tax=Tieghemostelium lacteum TaxID=361077 RepID=A0A151Z753_TIELA|nr:hypothetical protein DLAC_09734 [Tieghemostelium lacteum]|eukprot:KYQ89765.1 hypothetical protein DLAC_09734 [Tieghemostelium lacteum]